MLETGTRTQTQYPPAAPRRRWGRRALVALAALLVVLSASAYWALDRFVIDHVEIEDVSVLEAEAAAGISSAQLASISGSSDDAELLSQVDGASPAAATVTADSYTSDLATIQISEISTGSGRDRITYFVADVVVADATLVRSAFANDQYGTNIVADTSEIAEANDAVFAINGDYYGFRDDGILIRNGVVYRDDGVRTGLAIYTDGTMAVYDETQTTAEDLVADGVWNTLSFGPALLVDGDVVEGIEDVEVDTNFGNHSIQGSQPRTGVGMISENHYVFVVVDGRSPGYSTGVTMTEFAEIFQELGATVAYNLDGGGSATMYFNGEVVNNPQGRGDERGVSDILYIGG